MEPTAQINLRRLRPTDAELLFAWRQEAASRQFNPLDNLTLAALKGRLATEGDDLNDRRLVSFRWLVELNGEPIGSVALKDVNWRMGYAELGYAITEGMHGKGIGTAVVAQLVARAFAQRELRRLIAYISVDNTASWRLVERLGFTREGRLRAHYVIQGLPVDEYVYGLLRDEWHPPWGGPAGPQR